MAVSLSRDPEATPVQGLRAPRAGMRMGAAQGAVIGKCTAAQRKARPESHGDHRLRCLLSQQGPLVSGVDR